MEGSIWKLERVPGEVDLAIGRAGEGADPVICLHGITAQHRAFNAAARHLGPSRGLVGVDLRGRGDSDKPESGYSLETHSADVVRVLDHLDLENAVLAGHSMGGFVALQTALEYPERVRALVLLDGGWPRVESPQREMTEEEKQEAAALEEGLARAFKRLDMTFESPEAYLDFWFPDQNVKMDDLRCPVALVRASQGFFPGSDPLISDEASDTMAGPLDIRTEILLEGANHYTMLWPYYTRVCAPMVFDPPFWER